MTAIHALDWFLRSLPGLTTLVGEAIYPDVARRGDKAHVVYEQTDAGFLETLGGDTGSQVPSFTIQVWAPERDEADAIGDAIVGAKAVGAAGYVKGLRNHRAGYWGPLNDRLYVNASTVEERSSVYAEPVDAGEKGWFGVQIQCTLHTE